MSDSNIYFLKDRFSAKAPNAPEGEAASAGIESVPDQTRHAFGYLTQLYGMMVGAGLYSDYDFGFGDRTVHMTMRRFGAKDYDPRHWMSFEQNSASGHWVFHYRGMALSHASLHQLARDAHRCIGRMERRELPPLLQCGPPVRLEAV